MSGEVVGSGGGGGGGVCGGCPRWEVDRRDGQHKVVAVLYSAS